MAGDFRQLSPRDGEPRDESECAKVGFPVHFRGSLAKDWLTVAEGIRNRLLLPVREELQNPNIASVRKPLETLEFGEPYRIGGVQSSGEK
jgi:hypothetical protein